MSKLIRWLKKVNLGGNFLQPGDGIRGYAPVIRHLCQDINPVSILELGTRGGDSTRMFLEYAPNARVVSVDINDCSGIISNPRWTFVKADDMEIPRWQFKNIDILLIDTSHEFAHTWLELRKFAPLVKQGGAILMHDTDPDWLMRSPVKKAIKKYLTNDDRNWMVSYYSDDDIDGNWLYGGLGVLRRI